MRWAAPLLLLPVMAGAGPAFADAIVIRSNGPDAAIWKVGRKVKTGEPIRLKAGTRLSLIDAAGSWELRGPADTRLGKRPVATASRLEIVQDLVLKRKRIGKPAGGGGSGTVARTAAMRSLGSTGAGEPVGWWEFDPKQTGYFCVLPDKPFVIARAQDGPASVDLIRTDKGEITRFEFAGKATRLTVRPSQRPALDGTTYRVRSGGISSAVRFVALEQVPADPVALADALLSHECTGQLDLLAGELTP